MQEPTLVRNLDRDRRRQYLGVRRLDADNADVDFIIVRHDSIKSDTCADTRANAAAHTSGAWSCASAGTTAWSSGAGGSA